MGFIENIQAREDLNDEQKAQLISEFSGEVDPLREQNQKLSARSRQETVEAEVVALSELGFNEAPGLLKFVRRVFLSDDSEPGTVLLSDSDMGLSGEKATGATGRQEMSTADTLREFIKLMPRSDEGKLNLSDMATAEENENRPNKGGGDKEERTAEARENLERITGRSLTRTRSRYQKGSNVEVTT